MILEIFLSTLDKEATFKELAKLGVDEITDEMMAVAHQYEKGEVSTDEFVEFFYQKFNMFYKTDLVRAWNAILLDFPKHRLEFLKN